MFKKTALAMLPLLTSCATIMNGSHQNVNISTEPCGATVKLDCFDVGTTPVRLGMERRNNHFVTLELPGYETTNICFKRTVSGWVFGNILFGGFIGLGVDVVSGGIFRLTPEQLQVELASSNIVSKNVDNDLNIIVVLKPKAEWEQVGTLVRNHTNY